MSNKTINALTAIPSVASDDLFAMWDTSVGATRKGTTTQVIAAIPAATGGAAGLMPAADKAKLDASTASATATTLVLRDSSGNTAVNVLTAGQVTISGVPTVSTDATNKAYVDSVAIGLTIKAAVVAATVGSNITLSGGAPSTLDGVSLSTSARVLVKDQTDPKQNGIYQVATLGSGSNGTWSRTTDADTGAELPTGSYVLVNGGTTLSSTSWVMNTPGTIVIGTSNIVWVLFSAVSNVPASSITGTLVASQIAAGAITVGKFAAGITPIEIVSTIPVSGNYEGRTVYLTTLDGLFAPDKIYRWTDTSTTGNTFWTSAVPAVDISGNLTNSQIADLAAAKLTGQITTTQITDGGISTAKLAAGSVTTAKIAALAVTASEIASGSITTGKLTAGAVTSNELSANSVIAGKVSAGAISTTELAALSVTAAKIASATITTTQIAANTIVAGNIATGTITADRMNVSTLSSISANIGTITSGSITGTSITNGSGFNLVTINGSGINVGTGRLLLGDVGGSPVFTVFNAGGVDCIKISGLNNSLLPAIIQTVNSSGIITGVWSSAALTLQNNANLFAGPGSTIYGGAAIRFNPGFADCLDWQAGETGSGGSFSAYIQVKLNGRTVNIPFYL